MSYSGKHAVEVVLSESDGVVVADEIGVEAESEEADERIGARGCGELQGLQSDPVFKNFSMGHMAWSSMIEFDLHNTAQHNN